MSGGLGNLALFYSNRLQSVPAKPCAFFAGDQVVKTASDLTSNLKAWGRYPSAGSRTLRAADRNIHGTKCMGRGNEKPISLWSAKGQVGHHLRQANLAQWVRLGVKAMHAILGAGP